MNSEETYTLAFNELIDPRMIFVAAVILLFSARRIARSTITYYVVAFICGLFASTMVLAYLLRSFLPRSSLIPLYFTSWPLSVYIFYKLSMNLDLLLNEYFSYFVTHLAVVLLLSCSFCYRVGTPTDRRTMNLVQWSLQLSALFAIYYSFRHLYLTTFFGLAAAFWSKALFVINYVVLDASAVFRRLRMKWHSPRPRRLLSKVEYKNEGVRNTEIELMKLRHALIEEIFYNNLDTDQLRCADRMGNFISGKSDMSETELRDYSIYAKSGYTAAPWMKHDDRSSSSDDGNDEGNEKETADHHSTVEKVIPLDPAGVTPDRPFLRKSPEVPNSGARNVKLLTPTTASTPPSSSMSNGSTKRLAASNGSPVRRIFNGHGVTPSPKGRSSATPVSSRRKTPNRGSLRESNGGRPYNSPLMQLAAVNVSSSPPATLRSGNYISPDEDEM